MPCAEEPTVVTPDPEFNVELVAAPAKAVTPAKVTVERSSCLPQDSLDMAAAMIARGEESGAVTLGAQEESKNDAESRRMTMMRLATSGNLEESVLDLDGDAIDHLEPDMLLFRRHRKGSRDSLLSRESDDDQKRLQTRTQMLLRHMSTTIQKEVEGQAACVDLMFFMVYVIVACTILYMQMNVGGGASTMYRSLITNMFTVESGVVNAYDGTMKEMLNSYDEFYDWIDEVCAPSRWRGGVLSCRARTPTPRPPAASKKQTIRR